MSQYQISKKRLAEIIKEEYDRLRSEDYNTTNEKLTLDQVEIDEEELDEKLDPVGKEDADVDNDGDEDNTDKYLKKRRNAIGKSMKSEALDSIRSLIHQELNKV
jgi:hypothetical protein